MVVFRNYVPKDEGLRLKVLRNEGGVPSREAEVILNEAKKKVRSLPSEDKPLSIAPKRANWDLKRDVDKRLKKLAKRTQRAIAELAEELNVDNEES